MINLSGFQLPNSEKKRKKNLHYFLTDVIMCDFAEDFCHWEVEASDEASGFFFSRVTSEDLQEIGIAGPEESQLGTMANLSLKRLNLCQFNY